MTLLTKDYDVIPQFHLRSSSFLGRQVEWPGSRLIHSMPNFFVDVRISSCHALLTPAFARKHEALRGRPTATPTMLQRAGPSCWRVRKDIHITLSGSQEDRVLSKRTASVERSGRGTASRSDWGLTKTGTMR